MPAIHNIRDSDFNLEQARQHSQESIQALGAQNDLQAMLAAQMLSIHSLQQRTMIYAQAIDDIALKKYYTNAGIKLANCFIQQAHTLAKLQGVKNTMVTVERVDVHDGGQAIVGTVQTHGGQ